MRHRRRLLTAVGALCLVAGACNSDVSSSETVAPDIAGSTAAPPTATGATAPPTTPETAAPTTSAPTDVDLAELVGALDDQISSCCEGGGDRVTFEWADGTGGALDRDMINRHAPEDARRGLDDPEYVRAGGGGFLAAEGVARFDCGDVRYTLTVAAGNDRAAAVVALSAAAGCDRPNVHAPTECLGLPDDPGECTE